MAEVSEAQIRDRYARGALVGGEDVGVLLAALDAERERVKNLEARIRAALTATFGDDEGKCHDEPGDRECLCWEWRQLAALPRTETT